VVLMAAECATRLRTSSVDRIGRSLLLVPVLLLAAQATTASLCAQVVSGRVIDSTSGVPVGTGFVVLLDSEGSEVARALSTSDGDFVLRAPSSGTYRLRSERIGYRAQESGLLNIRADGTLTFTLKIIALPVILAAVEVRGMDECAVNPERAAATAVIWEEIRKALAATTWDSAQELAHYRGYSYERDLAQHRTRVTREEGRSIEGLAGQPYVSLPAEQLARDGYAVERDDGLWYNLPDARVLLDDSFLSTHCFHVVRDSVDRPGLVGLAFDPVASRAVADVRGTLWLAEESSGLASLEVSFTNLPGWVRDDRVGGTVDFMQLPSGAWIVQRWQVRTPKTVREASVTIVVIHKRSNFFGRWPYRLYALSGENRYSIGVYSPRGDADTTSTHVPWNADGLVLETESVRRGVERTFSGTLRLEPGEILMIRCPEDLRPGGLLNPED
jgi:hypothetical protein